MGLIPVVILAVLFFGILRRAWARRQDFEQRMQVLEVAGMAVRRGMSLVPLFRRLSYEQGRFRRRGIQRIARDLEHGEELSEALSWGLPESFPPHVVNAIREAEGSDQFGEALESLITEADDRLVVQHRLALTLLYPVCLGLAALLAQEFMVGLASWSGFGQLPISSFSVADIVAGRGGLSGWAIFAGGLLGTMLCLGMLWRRMRFLRRALASAWSQVCWRSKTVRTLSAAQFLRTLSHLVAAGQSLPKAMRRAVGAVGSARMELDVQRAADALEAGMAPNDAWRITGLPEFAVASVCASTATAPGRLALALRRASDVCRERYLTHRDRWLDLLHPAGLFVFAGFVAVNLGVVVMLSSYCREVYPWLW